MSSAKNDYYKILNVTRNANADEIRKSYYKLAKKYHPDRNSSPDAEAKFKLIKKAYETLSNQTSRSDYDLQYEQSRPSSETHTKRSQTHETFNQNYNMNYNQEYHQEFHQEYPSNGTYFTFRFKSFNYSCPPSPPHPSSTWSFNSSTNRFNYEDGCSFKAGTNFPNTNTKFGNGCKFGKNCNFSYKCRFGNGCYFSDNCNFQNESQFSSGCSFGSNQNFGDCCKFASGCSFGSNCNFGNNCSFGSGCNILGGSNFGNNCHFGTGCRRFDN